jgi:hypothetical protein
VADAATVVEISAGLKMMIAMVTLTFNGAVIGYLLWKGKPDNSLHSSALSWSYISGLTILAGLGFGAVAPLLANVKIAM